MKTKISFILILVLVLFAKGNIFCVEWQTKLGFKMRNQN
jgi:hypothetical protein